MSAGGYTPGSAEEHVKRLGERGWENEMVVFGRLFIANVSSCVLDGK